MLDLFGCPWSRSERVAYVNSHHTAAMPLQVRGGKPRPHCCVLELSCAWEGTTEQRQVGRDEDATARLHPVSPSVYVSDARRGGRGVKEGQPPAELIQMEMRDCYLAGRHPFIGQLVAPL